MNDNHNIDFLWTNSERAKVNAAAKSLRGLHDMLVVKHKKVKRELGKFDDTWSGDWCFENLCSVRQETGDMMKEVRRLLTAIEGAM